MRRLYGAASGLDGFSAAVGAGAGAGGAHLITASWSRRSRIVALLVVLLSLSAGWLAWRAVQIRGHLVAARTALAQPATLDAAQVRLAVRTATPRLAAAARAADDPVWRAAAAIPWLGRSFDVVAGIADIGADLATTALPGLDQAATTIAARPLLASGQVDLGVLATLRGPVLRAEESVRKADAEARALPRGLLPPQVRTARDDVVGEIGRLASGLSAARTALDLAPGMLGAQGPRRYFMAVHNNAESRGTGGLVGAYAVLRVDKGRLTRERVGTDRDFKTAKEPVVDLGPEFAAHYDYANGARVYWSSAVLTPDWPSAAQILAGLWEAQSGTAISGVVGIDPISMAVLLRATPPATVDGRRIDASNVADFVMRDEYAIYEGKEQARKDALSQLAAQLFDLVTSGASSRTALLQAFAEAASGGHLQVWSRVAPEQARLEKLRVGGALPARPGAYLQIVTSNGAGNKADYYIRRAVSYRRTAPGRAVVRLELTNLVDPTKVPPIVIGRVDKPSYSVDPGQTNLITTVYVGVGQRVHSLKLDGKPVGLVTGTERGHGWAALGVEVSPRRPTVLEAEVDDPGGHLIYRQQPLVVDDELDLQVDHALR